MHRKSNRKTRSLWRIAFHQVNCFVVSHYYCEFYFRFIRDFERHECRVYHDRQIFQKNKSDVRKNHLVRIKINRAMIDHVSKKKLKPV